MIFLPCPESVSSALWGLSVPFPLLVHSLQLQGHPFLHSRTLFLREREEKEKGGGERKRQNLEIITAIILTFRATVEVQSYSDP